MLGIPVHINPHLVNHAAQPFGQHHAHGGLYLARDCIASAAAFHLRTGSAACCQMCRETVSNRQQSIPRSLLGLWSKRSLLEDCYELPCSAVSFPAAARAHTPVIRTNCTSVCLAIDDLVHKQHGTLCAKETFHVLWSWQVLHLEVQTCDRQPHVHY